MPYKVIRIVALPNTSIEIEANTSFIRTELINPKTKMKEILVTVKCKESDVVSDSETDECDVQ